MVGIIVSVIGVVAFISGVALVARHADRKVIGVIGSVVGLIMVIGSCLYTQDIGETVVVRNLGGSVAGSTEDAGFHFKAPWQDVVKYDVRNNVVSFIGDGTEDYFGGSANGPQITANDSGGSKVDLDLQINYSLDPSIAETLYSQYGTQESFVKKVVAPIARSIPRDVIGKYTTIEVLTNVDAVSKAIREALEQEWSGLGINVDLVNVQGRRYDSAITDRYNAAQAAAVAKQEAQNKQETAKVEAETKVIQAQGEADANAALSESLSPEVLQSQYNEALQTAAENGCLVVASENSPVVLNTSKE